MSQHWLTSDGQVVHPNAPRGGGGAGGFRNAKHFGAEADGHGIAHPNSPVGRNVILSEGGSQLASGGGRLAVRILQGMIMGASHAPQGENAQTSGANNNFAAAQRAAQYVLKIMDIGADNRIPQRFVVTLNYPKHLCVNEMRDRTKKELDDLAKLRAKSGQGVGWKDQLDIGADWAKFYGCGNCGEHSSLAFVYLRDVEKLHPLDWMDYDNMTHAFVIVGRPSGTLPANPLDEVDADVIKDWGPTAVLCDAYYGNVVGMPKLISHFKGRKLRLLHRLK